MYNKQWNLGDLVSRKRIIYCANVYESTSFMGVSVWWLKMVFLAVADGKCFSLPRICRKCSIEFWLSSSLNLFLN